MILIIIKIPYRYWQIEVDKHKSGQKASLLYACLRTFGPKYLLLTIYGLFVVIIIKLKYYSKKDIKNNKYLNTCPNVFHFSSKSF